MSENTRMRKNDVSLNKFIMKPIGYVRCPQLKTREGYKAKERGQKFPAKAVIDKRLSDALDEIETFDHVWLIWVFDKNIGAGYKTKVSPPADQSQPRGLFVTRSPFRPNPIGLSCVKVTGHNKNILKFENSDILDGTPILDIKPYIPSSDSHPDSKAGWLDKLNR